MYTYRCCEPGATGIADGGPEAVSEAAATAGLTGVAITDETPPPLAVVGGPLLTILITC